MNSNKMEVRLPDEKAQELQILLEEWSGRCHSRKRELLSLIGKLAHAYKIVRTTVPSQNDKPSITSKKTGPLGAS